MKNEGGSEKAAALSTFVEEGYVVLDELLPHALVEELRMAYLDAFARKIARSGVRPYEGRRALDGTSTVAFVPRGGNHDINRWNMHLASKMPFFHPQVIAHPVATEIARAVLGDACVLAIVASDTPLPGAEEQDAHQDFVGLRVTVNIPLVDVDDDNAPLEVWPRSHRPIGAPFEGDYRISTVERERWVREERPRRLLLPAGSILVRDQRLLHRGTDHRADAPRPMLSLVYIQSPDDVPPLFASDLAATIGLVARRAAARTTSFDAGVRWLNWANALGRRVEFLSGSDRDRRRRIPASLWSELPPDARRLLRHASIEGRDDRPGKRGASRRFFAKLLPRAGAFGGVPQMAAERAGTKGAAAASRAKSSGGDVPTASQAESGAPEQSPRDALARLTDLAAPHAVRAAVTLGVVSAIAEGTTTLAALAERVDADESALRRLMRYLVSRGVFAEIAPDTFALTDVSRLLAADERTRAWLDQDGVAGRLDRAWSGLTQAIRTGEPAYRHVHGRTLWADLAGDPELHASFDRLMAAHAASFAPDLLAALPWPLVRHVVDVGGGNGALLAALLRAQPSLRGTLVDLEAPARAAQKYFEASGLSARCEAVAQNYFEELPGGADVYILANVLHDLDDREAASVLLRVAAAAADRGQVLVIESMFVAAEPLSKPLIEMDLRTLVAFPGKKRSVDEIVRLAEPAGLHLRSHCRMPGGLTLAVFSRRRLRGSEEIGQERLRSGQERVP